MSPSCNPATGRYRDQHGHTARERVMFRTRVVHLPSVTCTNTAVLRGHRGAAVLSEPGHVRTNP